MSKSLAFRSEASRVGLEASHTPEDPHASLGMQGLRIHQLMDSLQGHQARQDPELQNKLLELERVLGGIDPLLEKVEKRLDCGHELPRDNSSSGGLGRRDSSSSAAATPRRPSGGKQRGRARLSTDGLHAVVDSDDEVDAAVHHASGTSGSSDSDLGDVKKVRWNVLCLLCLTELQAAFLVSPPTSWGWSRSRPEPTLSVSLALVCGVLSLASPGQQSTGDSSLFFAVVNFFLSCGIFPECVDEKVRCTLQARTVSQANPAASSSI